MTSICCDVTTNFDKILSVAKEYKTSWKSSCRKFRSSKLKKQLLEESQFWGYLRSDSFFFNPKMYLLKHFYPRNWKCTSSSSRVREISRNFSCSVLAFFWIFFSRSRSVAVWVPGCVGKSKIKCACFCNPPCRNFYLRAVSKIESCAILSDHFLYANLSSFLSQTAMAICYEIYWIQRCGRSALIKFHSHFFLCPSIMYCGQWW